MLKELRQEENKIVEVPKDVDESQEMELRKEKNKVVEVMKAVEEPANLKPKRRQIQGDIKMYQY